jgi:two-component system sensor kinase FixL
VLPAIVVFESILAAVLVAWVWLLYRRLTRAAAAASTAEARQREAERALEHFEANLAVERKEAERQAAALREELAHFGRVSLVEALTGSLAHEINQPLTAVMANTEAALRLMTAQPPRWHELRETLNEVLADNRRAGDVLQRMRTLLKKGATRYEPIELNGIVREVVKVVQTYVTGRQIAFDIELASDLPAVMGDRVQVQQVLLNLLMNAFDAVAAREAADRHVRLQTVSRAQTAFVDVTDRGAGLSDDELAVIFEPFYTTKGEGLGLGLSISRAIVTAHGGTLGATRNREAGMTFSASFPCWPPPSPDQPASAAARLQGQR